MRCRPSQFLTFIQGRGKPVGLFHPHAAFAIKVRCRLPSPAYLGALSLETSGHKGLLGQSATGWCHGGHTIHNTTVTQDTGRRPAVQLSNIVAGAPAASMCTFRLKCSTTTGSSASSVLAKQQAMLWWKLSAACPLRQACTACKLTWPMAQWLDPCVSV